MLAQAIAHLFKHKIVNSIVILACYWNLKDQVDFIRQLSDQGIIATFSCDVTNLNKTRNDRFQGILYVKHGNDFLLDKVKKEQFSIWYKWLVIGDELPLRLDGVRYDADIAFLRTRSNISDGLYSLDMDVTYVEDVYVNPVEGASHHPWAESSGAGFLVTHERDRILRRMDVKSHAIMIATPIGVFDAHTYKGTFKDYLTDESIPEKDSSVRSAYMVSSIILEVIKAKEVLVDVAFWNALNNNDSMLHLVSTGQSQISGAILRIMLARVQILDFVIPIWPFGTGFTYLAERQSSSNMYLEPFSPGVWWCCFATGIILALVQRLTAKKSEEKESAYIDVLATYLQQDASSVPEGLSGRWSFTVLSISAMLIHAYYTSAIVSALMSSGRSGPENLRALGDSKFAIASEDYHYMRYLFFEVETKWPDLEYLKRKKKTSKFYQSMETGVKLVQEGGTAYHTEYNQIYSQLGRFTDEQSCKLQYVDTIPVSLAWIVSSKRGEWTELFRSRGAWLRETGVLTRVISKIKLRPPPCRSSMLAERVKFGDVAPLLGVTVLGAVASFIVLGLEIMFDRAWRKISVKRTRVGSHVSVEDVE